MAEHRPVRVLHSVGSLNRGGIETWLMNVLRSAHPGLTMDFVVYVPPGHSGDYEAEAMRLGSRVFHQPTASRLRRRLTALGVLRRDSALRDLLKSGGYDVFHAHGEELVGDAVREAALAGIPVRVAHCHHTRIARGKTGPEMWLRRLRHAYVERPMLLRYATDLVACGRDAGRLMLGDAWGRDSRCRVIYCGVSLSAIGRAAAETSRTELLARYGFPPDARVVGHAGSMGPTPVKNHAFLVDIFAELARRDTRWRLVMAGDGPLRDSIWRQVESLGLQARVRMPGVISDVPAHMARLFDVHVLPSLAEGLPVVAIEAAAAGLFSVMSDAITDEFEEVLPGRSARLPLSATPGLWANCIEEAVGRREAVEAGLARVSATRFNIENSAESLHSLYCDRLAALGLR